METVEHFAVQRTTHLMKTLINQVSLQAPAARQARIVVEDLNAILLRLVI
jgi:hypothetical protein